MTRSFWFCAMTVVYSLGVVSYPCCVLAGWIIPVRKYTEH